MIPQRTRINRLDGWMDGWIDIHRQNEKWMVDIKYIGIYKSIGLNSSRKLSALASEFIL